MKSLFVCATGGFGRQQLGGAERFLMEMLPEFAKHIEVAAVVPCGPVAEALGRSGVHVYHAGPTKRIDLMYRSAIRAAIHDFHPDVVSAHLLSAAMHTRSLRGRDIPSARLIVTLHNSLRQYVETSTDDLRARARFNLLLDRFQRGARRHTSVAVSLYEEQELAAIKFGGPVRCIPNPLPRGFGGPGRHQKGAARASLGLPESGRIFAYVGRMEFEKGVDLLDPISQHLGEEDILVAFGDGMIKPASPRVLAMGRTDRPELVWAAADAVVVPSRVESFGRVALEAAASGTPVVHTGVGGLQELLANAEGVLAYTTPIDPLALAHNMIEAATDEVRLNCARAELADQYVQKYGFATKVGEWLDVLLAVSERPT